MNINRRFLLKGLSISGLIMLSNISIRPSMETLDARIQRLFSICPSKTCFPTQTISPALISPPPLSLRKPSNVLLEMSDSAFIMEIDYNIREDFSEDQIIELAGWQLAFTEVAIMGLIKNSTIK